MTRRKQRNRSDQDADASHPRNSRHHVRSPLSIRAGLSRERATACRRLAHQLAKQLRGALVDDRSLVVPLLPADAKSRVERRVPTLVFGVQLGAPFRQEPYGCIVTAGSSRMERGLSVGVEGVDVDACLET